MYLLEKCFCQEHAVNARSFDIFGFVLTYPKNKAFPLNVFGDVLVYSIGNQTRIQAFAGSRSLACVMQVRSLRIHIAKSVC